VAVVARWFWLFLFVWSLVSVAVSAAAEPAGPWAKEHTSLEYNFAFVPPHNEPVVGDKVARYRAQISPSLTTKWFRYHLDINAWLVNTWQSRDVVGNDWEAWRKSDWGVEDVRLSLLHRFSVGPEKVGLFVENYQPIDRHSWGGQGMERHYYWLVGVGGRLW